MTSFPFFIFLLAVFGLWDLLKGSVRKGWLLLASYIFYFWMSGSPRFCVLLLASTLASFFLARLIQAHPEKGKLYLALGCVFQLGLLVFFKYLGSFLGAFWPQLAQGRFFHLLTASPLGLSFFSFAIVGYLMDVYRGKISAEASLLDYAVFVAFFPCLLAGPIGQARSFLPQLKQEPRFDLTQRKGGMLLFIFGMFEKMVLADTLAIPINTAFANIDQSPLTWILILLLYSLQIYFDFAAYSSMAIGIGQALGFTLIENFRAPYWSTSVRSFWKKWHISLTSWLREYLYFPLGGNRKGTARTYLNTLIVFSVSGLWHGAALHYVLWGALNGLLQVIERMLSPLQDRLSAGLRGKAVLLYKCLCGGLTYIAMSATWTLFRVDSLHQLRQILGQIAGVVHTGFGTVSYVALGLHKAQLVVAFAAFLLCTYVNLRRARGKDFRKLASSNVPYYATALIIGLAVALFGVYGSGFEPQSFIYFKY